MCRKVLFPILEGGLQCSTTRSIAFYEQALKPLGIADFLAYEGQDGHPDLKGFGKDGRFFFWLKEGRPDPDTVHFGFVAKSHAEVNAFFVAAIAAGGREKTAPAPQLQYHPDYYATWVLDRDGHDVEVVNKGDAAIPPRGSAREPLMGATDPK
jgi:hypothetical protein